MFERFFFAMPLFVLAQNCCLMLFIHLEAANFWAVVGGGGGGGKADVVLLFPSPFFFIHINPYHSIQIYVE